jgi:hypothetical protein
VFNDIMIITDKRTREKMIELISVNIEFDNDAVASVRNIWESTLSIVGIILPLKI